MSLHDVAARQAREARGIPHDSGWVPTGRHTRCPECLSVGGLFVRPLDDGTWESRCFDCGYEGPAAPKAREEQGRWVDGLGEEPYP